jgi:hypothetical protein
MNGWIESCAKLYSAQSKDLAMDRVKRHFAILLLLLPIGCVQRTLTVVTDPPGAVVYLNDREMGRTPFTHAFLWYGNYDVLIRKDGWQTLKTFAVVNAPLWQFVPLDAVTDFLPLQDHQTISFKLKPDAPTDPQLLLAHGVEMKNALEASDHTVRHSVLDVHAPPKPATTQSATTQSTTTQSTTTQSAATQSATEPTMPDPDH